MDECKSVNILGTKYTIRVVSEKEDEKLAEADGYCDTSIKDIVLREEVLVPSVDSVADPKSYLLKVLRHEIVHAFLFESGLHANSWAGNEEIVDWIAMQLPKINCVFLCAEGVVDG